MNVRKINKKLSRVVSMVCIITMLLSMFLPTLNLSARGEEDIQYAHSINVFSISLRSGAEYYNTYNPTDPNPEIADPSITNDEGVYVWKAEKATEGHKFVYNIKMSISGEGASDDSAAGEFGDAASEAVSSEGFIEIRIPAHILNFKGRQTGEPLADGTMPDTIELPVPEVSNVPYKEVVVNEETGETKKVYSGNHDFVYKYDEETDEYVIFNIKPVSAGVVYEFPVAYRMNQPTWDYEDLEPSAACEAKISVNSWEKGTSPTDPGNEELRLNARSNGVPVYIDTNAQIRKVNKTVSSEFLTPDQLKEKLNLKNGVEDGYRYVIWNVSSTITNVTQKYNLVFEDTLDNLTGTDGQDNEYDIAGEVWGIKFGNNTFIRYDNENTANNKLENLTAEGNRTDVIIVRYPYEVDGGQGIKDVEEAALDKNFSAENNVEVTLVPADGKDNVSVENDDGIYRWKKEMAKWQPVVSIYKPSKYGIYNDNKRVANKYNVTSYMLSRLGSEETQRGEVPGLRYETHTSSYSYGKTIENLNDVISSLKTSPADSDGNVTVTAVPEDAETGSDRIYSFNENNRTSFRYNGSEITFESLGFDFSGAQKLAAIDMQRVAAMHLNNTYYGQKKLKYSFTDNTFNLIHNIANPSNPDSAILLDENDYRIDYVDFQMDVKSFTYDPENMKYEESRLNEVYSDDEEDNTLLFYVYSEGEKKGPVARYNIESGTGIILDSSYVDMINSGRITLKKEADVTGYEIDCVNKYFYVDLTTFPTVTLKPSEKIAEKIDPILAVGEGVEKKIALKNTASFKITQDGEGGETVYENQTISGTDYIAAIERHSSIRKKALGEKTEYIGKDGSVYKSENDTLLGQYRLTWQTTVSETANGIYVNNVLVPNAPISQDSGIFYDLLPSHCDIIEGSVNVYADLDKDISKGASPLSPSAFEVLDRIDNYNGSGKKLLIIKIKQPCAKSYTVAYTTVHSHEDIQDYGSYVVNTVAYQTGNPDIGDGYPDNGGNHAVSMSDYIKDLDPDNNGAKRFIYAESTEDILALFPTSSGIYKKVATSSNPTFARSGVVYSDDSYTYNFRMKNDSGTTARDIAILDSIENFRTYTDSNGEDHNVNNGLLKDRDWHGIVTSFDLSGVEAKMGEYKEDLKLILYISDDVETDVVDLGQDIYSDKEARRYLLRKILGETFDENDAINRILRDEAVEEEDYPVNGTVQEQENYISQYDAAHFTEKKDELDRVASKWVVVKNWDDITKAADGSSIDPKKVGGFIVYTGKSFTLGKSESLSFNMNMKTPDKGVKHHGENELDVENGVYLTRPRTYNNVYRSFTTYPDLGGDSDSHATYFYTHYDYTQLEYCTVGNVKFYKVDEKTDEGIEGIVFNLSGVSDYGTAYNETLVSDSTGYVTFENLERGTYQLIESSSDPDHLLDTTPREVKITVDGKFIFVTVDGEVIKGDDVNGYLLTNAPRYHGEFSFKKLDNLSGKGVQGAVFTLTGVSDHGTKYNLEAISDEYGNVSFGDIEKGAYTLTETYTPDGYEPPINNIYTVTSTGEKNVVFTITGENAGKDTDGSNYIKNIPLSEMTIIKVDSITKEKLEDASFTLTADASMTERLDELQTRLPAEQFHWVKEGGVWKQTTDGANTARGDYQFKGLPCGTYTLVETTPLGYEKAVDSYAITVEADIDAGRNVITYDPENEMEYVFLDLKKGDYESTSKENAQYYRLLNNEKYEDKKTVIKSWVGRTLTDPNSFPILHLSSEKQESTAKKATIDKTRLTNALTQLNIATTITGFGKSDSLTIPDGAIDVTADIPGEEAKIYVYKDGNNLKWWTDDAEIAYLPADCEGLFMNRSSLTSVDLTGLYVDKVTTFKDAFKGCSNLTTVTFNDPGLNNANFANGEKITSLESMFEGCSKLTEVDMRYLETSPALTSTKAMFKDCVLIESINLSSLNTSGVTDMSYMFGMSDEANSNKISEDPTLNNSLTTLDISNFETGNCTTFKAMFQGLNKLTNIKLDYTKFVAGSDLTSVERMFNACRELIGIDLRGFGACENLTSVERWFRRCLALTYIDLSNFSTSTNLNNIKGIFYDTSRNFTSSSIGSDNGCRIFAKGKWVNSYTVPKGQSDVNYYYIRINMFGKMYKSTNNDRESSKFLDVNYQGDSLSLDDNNSRLHEKYFMSAYKKNSTEYCDFYAAFAAATYGNNSDDPGNDPGNDPGDDPSQDETVDSYPNFSPVGPSSEEEADGKSDSDIGSKTFVFEYETGSGAGNVSESTDPVTGETIYLVNETVYMTVKKIIKKDDDKYYVVSQKYMYNPPSGESVKAVWRNVGRTDNGNSQWECDMMVQNADGEFFFWEDPVTGFNSTADSNSPVFTSGREDKPVVVNSDETVKVGSLELSKSLSGESAGKYSDDEFTVKVTMLNSDDSPYAMAPFDENGVAYFKIKAFAEDTDRVIIKGIPVGCKYTVEETDIPEGYDFVAISGGAEDTVVDGVLDGEIVEGNKNALVQNRVKISKLSITKSAEIYRKDGSTGNYVLMTAEDNGTDLDYIAWMNQKFEYTFLFGNLIEGKEYTYYIYDNPVTAESVPAGQGSFTAESELQLVKAEIKPGQTLIFEELPVGTEYSVSEDNSAFTESEDVMYEVNYVITGGSVASGEVSGNEYYIETRTLSDDPDEIGYTNVKKIDRPETVSVKVTKQWFDSDDTDNPVEFSMDENGNVVTNPAGDYPSFVRVVVGRALKYEYTETVGDEAVTKTLLMEPEAAYESYSINVKDLLNARIAELNDPDTTIDGWDYEFAGLPKYGELVYYDESTQRNRTIICEYVYFVSEIMPLGFENINDDADKINISNSEFFRTTADVEENKYNCTLKNKKIATYSLTVTKYVTGNMSDMTKEYSFEVDLKDASGNALTGTGFIVEFTDAAGKIVRSRTYTSETGKLTIGIAHCNTFIISNLPKNTKYTITEKNSSLGGSRVYSGQVDVNDASRYDSETGKPVYDAVLSVFEGNSDYETNKRSGQLTKDVSYLYWNDSNGQIPTGISLKYKVPMLLSSALAAAIVFIIFRKRKEENE